MVAHTHRWDAGVMRRQEAFVRARFPATILFAIAAVTIRLSAQEPASQWDRYVPGRLQSIVDGHSAVIAESPAEDSVLAISAKDFPTRATLTYVGASRPLPPHKRAFLTKWLRSMGKDTALASRYSREVHFREGQTSFWLPVQDGMTEWAEANLKAGEVTTVFVMFLGARRVHGTTEWMFFATGI